MVNGEVGGAEVEPGDPGSAGVADVFRSVVGEAAVRTDDTLWRFAAAGVVPACVVLPRTVGDVATTVRTAAAHDFAVLPAGSGGNLGIGAPPRRYDAALSTREMHRIVAHEAGDMTITAEAGVTLAQLNDALERCGQWLPLDPPRGAELTIGGLIAADRCGPSRYACGKVRDYLIGIRVVTADGEVLSGGGRVVKNVAGYDVPKLFIGSYGTLGVIIEATFKVRPRPTAERLAVWPAPSIEEATQRGLALRDTTVTPLFIDAVNGQGAESIGISQDPTLLVGCAGTESEVAAQAAALDSRSGATIRWYEPPQSHAMVKALRAFSQAATDDTLVARISTVPAVLPTLLQRFESEATSRKVLLETGAHAGIGVAWCQIHAAHDPPLLAFYAEWMRIQTRHVGGWVVFEHVPKVIRDRLDPWGYAEPSVPLMVGIKRALDPRGIFSPGRFVGGI